MCFGDVFDTTMFPVHAPFVDHTAMHKLRTCPSTLYYGEQTLNTGYATLHQLHFMRPELEVYHSTKN